MLGLFTAAGAETTGMPVPTDSLASHIRSMPTCSEVALRQTYLAIAIAIASFIGIISTVLA